MKTLVLYDSLYGNTEKIAKAISKALPSSALLYIKKKKLPDFRSYKLLIVGSPTHGGRPSMAMQEFLNTIPNISGLRVAAFDTRFSKAEHGVGLVLLMRIVGFAADRISVSLQKKGGVEVIAPEGFIVEGKEGPLKKGELTRACLWAKKLYSLV